METRQSCNQRIASHQQGVPILRKTLPSLLPSLEDITPFPPRGPRASAEAFNTARSLKLSKDPPNHVPAHSRADTLKSVQRELACHSIDSCLNHYGDNRRYQGRWTRVAFPGSSHGTRRPDTLFVTDETGDPFSSPVCHSTPRGLWSPVSLTAERSGLHRCRSAVT
jgi:hypothetical protein